GRDHRHRELVTRGDAIDLVLHGTGVGVDIDAHWVRGWSSDNGLFRLHEGRRKANHFLTLLLQVQLPVISPAAARWRNGDAGTGNRLVSWFKSRLGLQAVRPRSRPSHRTADLWRLGRMQRPGAARGRRTRRPSLG